ncbi:MAG: lipopolysaccharide assembly protein LapA domain-containing protein [Myxococcota bacterium]|jgi:uncharacterized membrane protein YciS (DUF1049 family)|nr:lipopolysaccharide assembly protein LapA domain-containing protein [Myxococcota bacterium]
MLMLRRVVLAAIVIALIVVVRLFPDQNDSRVDIDLLLTTIEGASLWLVLVVTFVGGALLAGLLSSLLLIKAGLLRRRYRKAIADLEAEVHHLRNLPLATGDTVDLGSDVGAVQPASPQEG